MCDVHTGGYRMEAPGSRLPGLIFRLIRSTGKASRSHPTNSVRPAPVVRWQASPQRPIDRDCGEYWTLSSLAQYHNTMENEAKSLILVSFLPPSKVGGDLANDLLPPAKRLCPADT
jgi:hypothetical protein